MLDTWQRAQSPHPSCHHCLGAAATCGEALDQRARGGENPTVRYGLEIKAVHARQPYRAWGVVIERLQCALGVEDAAAASDQQCGRCTTINLELIAAADESFR